MKCEREKTGKRERKGKGENAELRKEGSKHTDRKWVKTKGKKCEGKKSEKEKDGVNGKGKKRKGERKEEEITQRKGKGRGDKGGLDKDIEEKGNG